MCHLQSPRCEDQIDAHFLSFRNVELGYDWKRYYKNVNVTEDTKHPRSNTHLLDGRIAPRTLNACHSGQV